MTPLAARLIRQIEATGPLTVADYMATCLLDPTHGYYATRDPFGAAGDFVTAPEITQMFGELIGLALAQAWMDQGQPQHFVLAELGPGRGTLMADALRAVKGLPDFLDAAHVHLIEASATLRDIQAQTLSTHQVTWADSLTDLPQAPLYLIANEFFDALPIRQFQRATAGWAERMVGARDAHLAWGLAPVSARADLVDRLADTKPGDIVETCAPAQPIVSEIAQRIAQHGGIALAIDYGDTDGFGDTFQALKNHKMVDPLTTPGDADLTAHVDFSALARTAAGTPGITTYLTSQGALLERLGIATRTQALARRMTGTPLQNHIAAHRRLTDPGEMGTLFKALALIPETAPLPPGFD